MAIAVTRGVDPASVAAPPPPTAPAPAPAITAGSAGHQRTGRVAVTVLVVLLLGLMAVQLTVGLRGDTATYDEPVNVRSGMLYAMEGDLVPNPEHPPFTKLLSGWSVRALRDDPRADLGAFRTIDFPQAPQYGQRVLATDARAQDVVRAGRVPMVILALLLGLVVFLFARDLFGPVPGVIALAAYSLAPEVIGHGHLATNDLPAAGFVVTSLWCALRLSRVPADRPGRRRAWLAAAGVALGLGLGTKYQVLLYGPAVAGAVGVAAWWSARADRLGTGQSYRRVVTWVSVVGLISVAWVWVVLLSIDVHGALHPLPNGFGERASGWSATVVDLLPLPAAYRSGLRYQLAYSEVPKQSFVLGESYWGHVAWYQPLVLTMKYPLVTLGLWVAGVVAIVRRRHLAAAVLVLAPAALVLVAGMAKAADIGDRYVIATPVLLAVAGGAAFAGLDWPRSWPGWRGDRGDRRLPAAGVVLALLVVSSALAAPRYISYVNQAWGGTNRAHERVADSAVDWGQDLGRLDDWLDRHAGGRAVYLSYFGTTLPSSVGIDARPFEPGRPVPPGAVVAVSATLYNRDRSELAPLGPVTTTVGGSILIFEPT